MIFTRIKFQTVYIKYFIFCGVIALSALWIFWCIGLVDGHDKKNKEQTSKSFFDESESNKKLSLIKRNIDILLRHLHKKYHSDHDSFNYDAHISRALNNNNNNINNNIEKTAFTKLIKNYKPNILHELPSKTATTTTGIIRSSSSGSAFEAYTINKGEAVYICLRDENGRMHDNDTIMFVALHELAHMSTEAINHPRDFWVAFRWILINAHEAGIIRLVDYDKHPRDYCKATKLSYSPAFDDDLV